MTSPGPYPSGDPTAPFDPTAYQGGYAGPPPTVPHPAVPQPAGYPPGYGTPPGYGYPPPGFPPPAPPPVPPGLVIIPGRPPMEAAMPSQRVLGRLIDSGGYAVLVAVAVFSIVKIVQHATETTYDNYGFPTSSGDDLAILWVYAIIAALWLVIVGYEAFTIGLTGATLGDRIMGVRFVRTKDGEPPGFARGLGRAGFLGVSFIGCYGLAFLLMLFSLFFDSGSGRYQSWPDKIFGLQAVSTKG